MSDPATRHRSTPSRQRPPGPGDRGQATVEFALALPLLAVVTLAIVQVGVSVRNATAVELAAREAVRAASVAADPAGAATRAATAAVDLPVSVATTTSGDRVTVRVTYLDPTDVAIIGAMIGDVTHTATATMTLEPP